MKQKRKHKAINVTIGKFPYAANGRANSLNAGQGFVKLVGDKETGQLLGGQIVGPEASNLIGELALAVEMGANSGGHRTYDSCTSNIDRNDHGCRGRCAWSPDSPTW